MSFISALMKVEIKNELDRFLDKQTANLKQLLLNGLDRKDVEIRMTLKSRTIRIEFTEFGLTDKSSILEVPYEKTFEETFSTGESKKDPVSGIFSAGKGDFVLNGTCELDGIQFEKKFLGKGVSIHKVSLDYELSAKFSETPKA